MHKTKEDRQREAQERQAKRDQRSISEQRVLCRQRPGKSEREIDRLWFLEMRNR